MGTDGKRILIALPNSVNEGIFDLVADKTGKIWYSRGTRIGVITP